MKIDKSHFMKCFLFIAISLLLSCGCSRDNAVAYTYPTGGDSDTANEKPNYLWIDAAANFNDFANSKDNIARDLAKAKDAGFTDVVVDVRPSEGDVLFRTDKCDQVGKLDYWFSGSYGYVERTATWDYLQAFIDAGHSIGLRVHAAFNTFVGGCHYYYGLGEQGLLFRDPSKKDWATVVNTAKGLCNVMDLQEADGYVTKFLNPANDDVQAYLISLLKDLAAYGDLDGIILDRGRYDDLGADFSDVSRTKFEKYIGKTVADWPSDIFPAGTSDLTYPLTSLQKSWLEFRAKVIRDFMQSARDAVKSVNPDVKFGVYVGGWYGSYYASGVNWASPKYDPSKDYPWASQNYKATGYADLMDQMLIGAYASPGNVYGSVEWTMQGFCKLAFDKIAGSCPIVAGGPDVGNWDAEGNYSEDQEHLAITNSVKACRNACNGYFLFDMCHLRSGNLWQYVKAGM